MDTSGQTPLVYPQVEPIRAAGLEVVSLHAKVVVSAAFFYNHVLTLGDEINFVWLRRWNIGTLIYAIARYLTAAILVYTLSIEGAFVSDIARYIYDPLPDECRGSYQLTDHCLPVAVCTADRCNFSAAVFTGDVYPTKALFYTATIVAFCSLCLLQMRTLALYNKDRRLKFMFCAMDLFLFVEKVLEATMVRKITHRKFRYILEQSPTATGGMHHYSRWASRQRWTNVYTPLFWLPFALVEFVTFVLVLRKAWPSLSRVFSTIFSWRYVLRRNAGTEHRCKFDVTQPAIVKTLIYDNFIYFITIFSMYILGTVLVLLDLYTKYSTLRTLSQIHLLSAITTTAILGSNLFLNLKKQYYNADSGYMDGASRSETASLSMFFAVPEVYSTGGVDEMVSDPHENVSGIGDTPDEIELDEFIPDSEEVP